MRHAVFLFLALIIIGGGWWIAHRNDPVSATDTENISDATSTATSAVVKAAAPKKDTGGSHAGLSYGEALKIFANRRVQFDVSCVATPNYLVLRNNTSVMFDNRSPDPREIALDGISYLLRGYDFRILTLHSTKLPHTVAVDCGSGRNNGQIVLE